MSDINELAAGEIAVIIPTYNQPDFLIEAVESVFAQEHLPKQVIVVNDGSTDHTNAVAMELCEKYPALIYIAQANGGVGEACWTGLQRVATEFVVRLDGDDTMPPNYLKELLKALKDQPSAVAFAYCPAKMFGAGGGWLPIHRWSIGRLAPENYIHVSSLMRTRVALDLGYFDRTLKGYEDWDFYLNLADHGFRGVPCSTTFLNYRQKPAGGRNTMTRAKDRELRARIYAKHPGIYGNAWYRFRIFCWRVNRRLGHWWKKMHKVS